MPKSPSKDYTPPRFDLTWDLPASFKTYRASHRLEELAATPAHMQGWLSPDVADPYAIKPAALKSKPSPRLEELSAPLPRKITVAVKK